MFLIHISRDLTKDDSSISTVYLLTDIHYVLNVDMVHR